MSDAADRGRLAPPPRGRAGCVSGVFDALLALVLALGYVALLLATARELGYARDEGFYFQAARSYGAWFDELWRDPARAVERAVVDRYWAANSEHPALMKSLFALSAKLLYGKWRLLADEGTAFRFPGMLMGGLGVAITYLWGARALGRAPGLIAALGFAAMPHVFHHAHLDCFDVPVAAMWLVTTWAYWRSLDPRAAARHPRLRAAGWAIATGVLYGLLLDTKHNAWLLPGALVLHALLARGARLGRDVRAGRFGAPLALFAMATLGPLVLYATWPWIWHDTGRRLAAWVAFHTGHEYYNMEFLGRTYWKPPFPRSYAWVMTAAIVPAVTLLLALIGIGRSVARASRAPLARLFARFGRLAPARPEAPGFAPDASTALLWGLSIFVSYAPWLSSGTPIFGGTKHWLTAYPFLCLFAAAGFRAVAAGIGELLAERVRSSGLVTAALVPCVVVGPAVIAIDAHPWGIAAYTPLVGGASGAATLGLNRTFWGYTTGSVAGFLNQHAPKGARVYVHDTAMQSWDQMVQDGRLRRDLRGSWTIAGSDFALYHHEPHMARVEQQIWVDYGTVRPVHVATYDGVPVVWVYERPR